MERSFFGLNLLKTQIVSVRREVLQARPIPLLVLLRILLLQPSDILRQFLQVPFKLAFLCLARFDSILA